LAANVGKTVGQLLAAPEMVNGLKELLYRVPGTNSAGHGAAFLVASVVFVSRVWQSVLVAPALLLQQSGAPPARA
jgi:hypothetical protein